MQLESFSSVPRLLFLKGNSCAQETVYLVREATHAKERNVKEITHENVQDVLRKKNPASCN
jgi:hypothetical protein